MAIIGFSNGKLTLLETAPEITIAEVLAVTEPDLFISANVAEMKI
jgi:acetate CoA/acetoacetate CoA-transferase beta subunit